MNISKRYFSERPHVPGTARSKELADEIAKTWKKYKFDEVEMPKYNVLLPYVEPNISNKVQILDTGNNIVLEFSGKEKVGDLIRLVQNSSRQDLFEGKLI